MHVQWLWSRAVQDARFADGSDGIWPRQSMCPYMVASSPCELCLGAVPPTNAATSALPDHSLRWDLPDVNFGLTLRDCSVVRSGARRYRENPNSMYVGILCCRISGGRTFT
jgi:hypothetical protein